MGNDVGLKQLILKEFHDSFAGGYSGIEGTKKRIGDHFYWKGLKHDVKEFVKQCEVCQRNKPENSAPTCLPQPLPIPEGI